MSFYNVNPREDAEKDVRLQKKSLHIEGEFNSKKYYVKNKSVRRMRNWAFVLVIVGFLILIGVMNFDYVDDKFALALSVYSILLSGVIFFVSFNINYTEHQKEAYDFYYDKLLEEINKNSDAKEVSKNQ